MRVLFISAGNPFNNILPFIKSQEQSVRDLGIEVDHFSITQQGLHGLKGYLKAAKMIKKLHKENDYNLLHAHYSYCGWVALFALTGLPVVVSFMGTDVYGFVDDKGNRKLKSYSVILSAKLLQFFVKRIIVKSKNLERSVFIKRKVKIIPNGVDFEKFNSRDQIVARHQLGLPLDKKIIVFLGNPQDPRKNFNLLSEALEYLQDIDVEVVTPFPLPSNEIPIYFNVAHIFVLTSFLEGSPNVVKEAMASGCPVISTDVGDVKGVISKTPGCYICEFDPKDLADKIRKSLEIKIPTTGREDIRHLELTNVAKKVISVYNEMIPSHTSPQRSLKSV